MLNGGTLRYTGGQVDTDRSFTLTSAGGSIDASGAGNAALVLSNAGPVAFSQTASPVTLTLTGSSTGANTLAAQIADPSPGGHTTVVKSGPGTWLLTGANTYTGGTVINQGILRIANSSPAAVVASGTVVALNGASALDLAGPTSALSDGTAAHSANVLNNSSAAVGLTISGANQRVGNIDGTGSTQVNTGSTLTANHVIQGALFIGGAQGSKSNVVIDISDESGNPLSDAATNGLLGNMRKTSGDAPTGIVGNSGPNSFLPSDVGVAGSTAPAFPAVPEPSTCAIACAVALGVGGIFLGKRRQK